MNAMNDLFGEIYSVPRTRCLKCGCNLPTPPEMNTSRMEWCDACRFLLRDPETGARYSTIRPSDRTMAALGLGTSFDERQADERIPNDCRVETWPELDGRAPERAPSGLDELLRAAA